MWQVFPDQITYDHDVQAAENAGIFCDKMSEIKNQSDITQSQRR